MKVGVVGATGLVGTEMLRLLDQRNFPVEELRAYASPRSEGRALPFKDRDVVCRVLADENVNVDMIEQNVSTDDHTDISFTVPRDELTRTMEIVDKVVVEIDAGGANFDDAIWRVSVVGAGMKTNPGVAAKMFATLADASVNIEMISTSAIRISCIVREADIERAVQELHTAFGLDTP